MKNIDPTRTITLRKSFVGLISRRYNLLIQFIRREIQKEDAFALNASRRFEFLSDEGKVKQFSDLFKTQVDAVFPSADPQIQKYLEQAYVRGLKNALSQIPSDLSDEVADLTGVQFVRGFTLDPKILARLRLMASKSIESIKGINSEMAAQMNRVLTDALIKGVNAGVTTSQMIETVNRAKRRASSVASSDIVASHADAQLDAFRLLGIKSVGIVAEWMTVGDDKVCPQCGDREGKRYSLEEAQGLIPLHPNCRCSWRPVIR